MKYLNDTLKEIYESVLAHGTAAIKVVEPEELEQQNNCKHENVDPQPSYLCEDCGHHLSVSEFQF